MFQSSGEVPKLAANDRAKATPEEATAVVRESIAYYGTYTANEAEKSLAVSTMEVRMPIWLADRNRSE